MIIIITIIIIKTILIIIKIIIIVTSYVVGAARILPPYSLLIIKKWPKEMEQGVWEGVCCLGHVKRQGTEVGGEG